MSQEQWTAVDDYFESFFTAPDPVLEYALKNSEQAGLPAIHVAANQGKLLMLLAQVHGAKRILEVGTLGGYSTIWLARALPADGKVITLEYNPKHAEVAAQNIAHAGFDQQVEIRVGKGVDVLAQLVEEGQAPFDFIFLDADKPSNPDYLQWSLKLSRPGSLIIADNVVRQGLVINADSDDPAIIGTRQLLETAAAEPRLEVTAIQTVGSKGYDGFALLRVLR